MRFFSYALLVAALMAGTSRAADVEITGGQTSVFLDPEVLGPLGLTVSGVTDDVIVPGSLPDSVAFGINPRDAVAPALATTFAYNSDDFLMTFMGTLEHTGSVFFTDAADDTTETGDFTIGFDAVRIVGDASGFFVRSNVGLEGTIFDLEAPSVLDASPHGLTAEARLLVSPELTMVLGSESLAGVTIGMAKIEAVPEPTSMSLALISGLALLITLRRRR